MKHPNRRDLSKMGVRASNRPARTLGIILLIAGSLIAPPSVLGSGSYDSLGASAGANQGYILGKSVLHKKLLCHGCPLSGTELNAGSAPALIERLQQPDAFGDAINAREREAVVAYLQRRFGP